MQRKPISFEAFAVVAALAIGFGVAFLWSASENKELARSKLYTGMALEAAQEKVLRESKGRESAESAERVVREKLAQETKAHQAAEDARLKAEAALEAAAAKLAQEETARRHSEKAWEQAENAFNALTAKIAELKAQESPRASAQDQGRLSSAKIAGELPVEETATTAKADAPAAEAGNGAAEASKDPASQETTAASQLENRSAVAVAGSSDGASSEDRVIQSRDSGPVDPVVR